MHASNIYKLATKVRNAREFFIRNSYGHYELMVYGCLTAIDISLRELAAAKKRGDKRIARIAYYKLTYGVRQLEQAYNDMLAHHAVDYMTDHCACGVIDAVGAVVPFGNEERCLVVENVVNTKYSTFAQQRTKELEETIVIGDEIDTPNTRGILAMFGL